MAYGGALGYTVPTVSVTVGPDYATDVNAFLNALKAVVEAKVTPGGIDINADLSFLSGSTYYRVKDLLGASFRNQTAALNATTYPRTAYFTGSDNDFYVNDGAGRQVRLTSAGAVNATTTGGITGSGYGSSSVEVAWDSGNQAYLLRSGAGANSYASAWLNDVLLNDGSGNFLTLAAPAMAADYTVTFPTAKPASTSVVQMDLNGTLTAAPNGNVATTGTLASGALTVTGAAAVSGLITATAGLTAAANQNVTISGTGDYKHGAFTKYYTGLAFREQITGSNRVFDTSVGSQVNSAGTAQTYTCPLDLRSGDRITSLIFYVVGGASAGTRTARVVRCTLGSNTKNTIQSGTSTANGVDDMITFSAFTYTLNSPDADEAYWLEYTTTATAGDGLYGVRFTYDHP